jgi:hypothetical protein
MEPNPQDILKNAAAAVDRLKKAGTASQNDLTALKAVIKMAEDEYAGRLIEQGNANRARARLRECQEALAIATAKPSTTHQD